MNPVLVEVLLIVAVALAALTWLAAGTTRTSMRRKPATRGARWAGSIVAAVQTLLLFGTMPQLSCQATTGERSLIVLAVAVSAIAAVWFVRRPPSATALALWQAYAVTVLVGSVVVAGTTLAVTTPCG